MKRIILLFLLCFSCQNNKEDFNLDVIPDNPLYFISIDSYDDLNYNEISFLDDILDIDIANDSLLDSSSEISYSFHKIGKDNYGKLISFNNSSVDIEEGNCTLMDFMPILSQAFPFILT